MIGSIPLASLPVIFSAEVGAYSLPLMSEATGAVLRATAKEEPDLRAVSDAIGRDASMAAHVLRMANSALHRGRDVVHTISTATARLGARRIREIAVIAASDT